MNITEHYTKNYKTYVARMKGRLQNLPADLAEDVVQEAYEKAIRYLDSFDSEKGSFDDWFNLILNNAANEIKKEELDKGVVRDVKSNDSITSRKEDANQIPILNGYEGEKKEIIKLYIWQDFTYKEISELVGCSHTKVRKTVSRFFKNVRMTDRDLIMELT